MTNYRSSSPLITVRNLSLHVPVVRPLDRSLLINPMGLIRDFYLFRNVRSTALLLDDINMSLFSGDRLGLIGANGAGKSTLLRTFAGIYQPSVGQLTVDGVASGLFDISLGMRADATGLENIYLRGLQMGLKLKKIRSLVSDIIEFAELEDDIDKLFGTYSSGMRVRLAIAISTTVEPDIMLLDEWIGVGDTAFNKKVRNRLLSLVEGSRGMVIATHNMDLMRSLCNRAVVLSKGRVTFDGDVESAIRTYQDN